MTLAAWFGVQRRRFAAAAWAFRNPGAVFVAQRMSGDRPSRYFVSFEYPDGSVSSAAGLRPGGIRL